MCGLFPVPAAFRQKPLSDFPAQPLFAEPGHPFLFCVCLSDFSRGEEILPFPQRAREISVESRTGARQRKKTIFEEDCFEEEKNNKTSSLGLDTPLATGTANTAPRRGVQKRLCSAVSSEIACRQSAASKGDTRPRTPSPSPSPSSPPTCKALSSPELQHPSAALLLLPHELP